VIGAVVRLHGRRLKSRGDRRVGTLTVTPEWRFEVSRRIKEEFDNGRDYYAMHRRDVEVPNDIGRQPDGRTDCEGRAAAKGRW
jgi:hypothetical protein